MYIYKNLYVLCFSVDCLLVGRPTDSQLKNAKLTSCCIYTIYLPKMGYKYVQNMYRTTEEEMEGPTSS